MRGAHDTMIEIELDGKKVEIADGLEQLWLREPFDDLLEKVQGFLIASLRGAKLGEMFLRAPPASLLSERGCIVFAGRVPLAAGESELAELHLRPSRPEFRTAVIRGCANGLVVLARSIVIAAQASQTRPARGNDQLHGMRFLELRDGFLRAREISALEQRIGEDSKG